MKSSIWFPRIAFLVLFSAVSAATLSAQQTSPLPDAGQLSPPEKTARYAQSVCTGCVAPVWDRGYMLSYQREKNFDRDHPVVMLYDRDGNLVREGRVWAPTSGSVRILAVGAAQKGGILAAASGTMIDGSIQGFLAATDLSGNPSRSLLTGPFETQHVCEMPDGTIWALGSDFGKENENDSAYDILRHYSFEKGLLGSYVSRDSISKACAFAERSRIQCGKNKIFAYLAPSGELVEVDSASDKATRWKVDVSPLEDGEVNGFAATEDGRIFVSVRYRPKAESAPGATLYELFVRPGTSLASLRPVAGTGAIDEPLLTNRISQLWGAEGNALVVSQTNDWVALSWVKVIPHEQQPSD